MRKCNKIVAFLGGAILLLTPMLAQALITSLTPLKDILKQSTFIVSAKVESVDAAKLAMVLIVEEDLKGKPPLRTLTVPLKGDAQAKKKNHVPQILKRVAPNLPLMLFVLQQGKKYTALAYTNGTWFQIVGVEVEGSVRWNFTHGEPYLRQTFKGTTAELKQTVLDALSSKKDPPKPDAKEKPGFGPEIPAEKKSEHRGSLIQGTLFAVIPSIFVGGPLAILSLFLPVVFGGLLLVLRRWLAALSALSAISTIYLLQDVCRRWLAGTWWATPSNLWLMMTVVTLVGLLWAWRRQTGTLALEASSSSIQMAPEQSTKSPSRLEVILLLLLSLLFLVFAVLTVPRSLLQLHLGDKMLLMMSAGVWVATLHTLARRWLFFGGGTGKAKLPGEGVLLWTMLLVSLLLSALGSQAPTADGSRSGESLSASGRWRYRVAWRFQPNVERCWIASSPRADGERVYIGVVLPSAFQSSGAVYCVDRSSGKEIWMFNDGGSMKPVFSSPCLAEGRVYIGEGFHEDADCKLYCLDAETGKKLWDFTTTSHTESTPAVAAGKVYFGAGDDGLYCLDAVSGKKKWHLEGLHIDANPLVIDNRLYGGSGVGETCKDCVLFCRNAETGEENWRVAVDLPVWGMPAAQGECLYAGIGNGNLLASADQLGTSERPAGAMLCLERATGNLVWRFDVPEGIHVRPCLDEQHIWFAARDRHCYCLDRRDRSLRWKTDLGSPIVASPFLVGRGANAGLYVAATKGLVNRLDPNTGKLEWTFDVSKDIAQSATVLSSPLVQEHVGGQVSTRSIWFGCGLSEFTRGILYCLEENAESP